MLCKRSLRVWFDHQTEEAAKCYVSIVKHSRIAARNPEPREGHRGGGAEALG